MATWEGQCVSFPVIFLWVSMGDWRAGHREGGSGGGMGEGEKVKVPAQVRALLKYPGSEVDLTIWLLPFQNRTCQKDFSIPRAQTRTSPYNDYEGRKVGS